MYSSTRPVIASSKTRRHEAPAGGAPGPPVARGDPFPAGAQSRLGSARAADHVLGAVRLGSQGLFPPAGGGRIRGVRRVLFPRGGRDDPAVHGHLLHRIGHRGPARGVSAVRAGRAGAAIGLRPRQGAGRDGPGGGAGARPHGARSPGGPQAHARRPGRVVPGPGAGGVCPDGAVVLHRLADGIDTGFPRRDDRLPDAAVAPVRGAVPLARGASLAPGDHPAESGHLRAGGLPARPVSCRRSDRRGTAVDGSVDDRDARLLRPFLRGCARPGVPRRPQGAGMTVSDLPALNASLNGTSAVLLCAGYVFIRRKRIAAHRACMLLALLTSALFLVSYLVYHYHVGSVPYRGSGWTRPLYFTLLTSHTILAAAVVPLALVTVARAARRRFGRPVAVARYTLPIWFYVSVTGVVIYLMLYGPSGSRPAP